MAFPTFLKTLRVELCLSPYPNTTPSTDEQKHQKLAMLVQTLKLLEKASEASGVPYLKGSPALALEVTQSIEGHRSNKEELDRLAMSCGMLMVNITNQIKVGGGLSKSMELLVEDLYRTLEKVKNTAKDIINVDGRARRLFAHWDISDRLSMLSKNVSDVQIKSITLVSIANAQNQEQAQDSIYDHQTEDISKKRAMHGRYHRV
ncbi:hypothetical protein B0H19DRAFT_148106 [Mycena capillaripes]|nr:hypothetical protein B0H19DRAFT_148106 [Mycena capillaripes]